MGCLPHGLNESQAADALNQKLNIRCHQCPQTVFSKKRLIHHFNAEHFCRINIEELTKSRLPGRKESNEFVPNERRRWSCASPNGEKKIEKGKNRKEVRLARSDVDEKAIKWQTGWRKVRA